MHAIQNWLERFCARHPRWGIPNLMRYIIIGNIIVYLLDMFTYYMASVYLSFSLPGILHGQIWRLVTFIFVPEASSNPIFFLLTLYFYYFIGSALEQEWGSGKFTIFYILGVILNVIVGCFVGAASMYYVNMSMFFSFATLYPNLQFLLFFFIPIKAKWLAWFDGAWFLVQIVRILLYSSTKLLALIPIVAVLNYLLFFGGDLLSAMGLGQKKRAHRHSKKTVDFHAAQKHVREKQGYLHKCAVCGRTDVTNPDMEFRYCSKCNGYYCYCSEHINSHIHVL